VPFINGGDGGREHPTQTLTDLYCLWRNHGTLSGLTVGLCGDLKYGRTVHSLAPALARFGSRLICIAPPPLQMPERFLAEVEALSGSRPTQTADLEAALPQLDCLYMTRIQKERFPEQAEYEAVAGSYVLDAALLARAPERMIVMHPLPRVDEISPAVDAHPRAVYFEQAAGGVHLRMALLAALWGLVDVPAGQMPLAEGVRRVPQAEVGPCSNPRCVTHAERGLSPHYWVLSDDPPAYRCEYCESEVRTLPLAPTT
jgi:aspartate carbamoyltransferase catalytic subunit